MYFSIEQLDDLQRGFREIGEAHDRLREQFVRRPFRSAGAREHADHGFSRRLGNLLHCVERVFEVLPPDRDDIPSRNETVAAAVAIQAFVMNAFGCCENLAWIWVEERGLTQANGRPLLPTMVGLGESYRLVRPTFSQEFRDYLHSRQPWFDNLKSFRDALAHRIPLYIPPFAIDPVDARRYNALDREAQALMIQGDVAGHDRARAAQKDLRHFSPVMTHSLVDAPGIVVFHFQLLADFSTIEELANEFLIELGR